MPRRRKEPVKPVNEPPLPPTPQPITETIEKNYMPYVMTAIYERAIPEIDGFKPSHRKILYTMYKMGLLTGPKTKSSNVVGQTMHIHPHGESIYETMARFTRGNESLLHPFIDSKGAFGKQYSRDMDCAAPRYTMVKLDSFAAECFSGIDKNAVDFIPNYDNTTTEPTLLPTTFPNILVNPNMGIAVGMSSNTCSFNLAEICDGTVALLKNPKLTVDKLMDIVKAPDFPGGGNYVYDEDELRAIYTTGAGTLRVRSRYVYDKQQNCIDILEIPYSTAIEVIINRIAALVKDGRLKEITDFRDEIDVSGFKLTVDLRRGVDPDALMNKLFRLTTLEDGFKCNFNILVDNTPRQLGVLDIMREWIRFRTGCVTRELNYDLDRKKEKLHLLLGLGKILLDIDKAIRIVRETEKEADVITNLMEGFGVDKIQAEYIAEIRLRHLNREYILNRIKEIETLRSEIAGLSDLVGDELKIRAYISKQLLEIKRKYGKPRKTRIITVTDEPYEEEDEDADTTPVTVLMTREGYIKKLASLKASSKEPPEQKLKDGDAVAWQYETTNDGEIIVFTDKAQAYKARLADFELIKANSLGDYVGVKLGFDAGERPVMMCVPDYGETDADETDAAEAAEVADAETADAGANMVFIFANGKGVRIPARAYATKTNRRKLTGAYSGSSPIVAAFYEDEPFELTLTVDETRAVIISTSLISVKTTRSSAGVTLVSLKPSQKLTSAVKTSQAGFENEQRYRKSKVPATPVVLAGADVRAGQLKL